MENYSGRTSEILGNTFRSSNLNVIWASFHKLVSGKRVTTESTTAAASSQPMKLICDKWRPAGLELLLTDRHQWAALGCQGRSE
jgi:hypothetical protein